MKADLGIAHGVILSHFSNFVKIFLVKSISKHIYCILKK